ncbi:MAG: hypothetical protein GX787_01985 [Tissierellia bacterium]|nr:hypothetical protein [Tissierellia bacterium]
MGLINLTKIHTTKGANVLKITLIKVSKENMDLVTLDLWFPDFIFIVAPGKYILFSTAPFIVIFFETVTKFPLTVPFTMMF